MYPRNDTIAAIATPPGEGGVAIIRICGPEAIVVADRIFSGPVPTYQSHTLHFGRILDAKGKTLDEGLLAVMTEGRSYTGDLTVEIYGHGGPLISRKVLERALESGARAAKPGEFTYRAFMAGKIDLAQAEAVQALIAAKGDLASEAASEQLQGRLSAKIRQFQISLIDIAAVLEAWVDFPEEGIEFQTLEELLSDLGRVSDQMKQLEASFHQGRLLAQGVAVCLVGAPNVGKSSLLNALADKERAIVTPIAGTTRDIVEEEIRLGGLHLRLIDTAGIRETDEVVEKEGIRRSRLAMQQADLVVCVLDASKPLDATDYALLDEVPSDKTVVVWNKSDLLGGDPPLIADKKFHTCLISAKHKSGLDELQQAFEKVLWLGAAPQKDEVQITSIRHKEALHNAITFCEQVASGLQQELSPEFLTSDLKASLRELGTIIGGDVTEDVLSAIFSKFCIGK